MQTSVWRFNLDARDRYGPLRLTWRVAFVIVDLERLADLVADRVAERAHMRTARSGPSLVTLAAGSASFPEVVLDRCFQEKAAVARGPQ